MKSKQTDAEMVELKDGTKIRRNRVAYGMKEVDEVGDGSKVLQTFTGRLYGRDAKTGALLRMDRLGGAAPVKGKAARKAAKRAKLRAKGD